MSQFEFTLPRGYSFICEFYNPLANYELLTGTSSAPEVSPTVYRGTTTKTGIVYMIATSGVFKAVGYINLDVPNANGYSEVFDTYEQAANAGLLGDIRAGQGGAVLPVPLDKKTLGRTKIKCGVDYVQQFMINVPNNWSRILFTAKLDHRNDTDANSIIQIEKTNPTAGTNGLIVLNKAVAPTPSYGSLAVAVDSLSITVTLKAAATVQLKPFDQCRYDFRIVKSDGSVPYVSEPAIILFESLVADAIT